MASVVTLVRVRSALIADSTQGTVNSDAQTLEHRAVVTFHCQEEDLFIRSPLQEGGGVLDLLLEGGYLSAGRVQGRFRRG